MTLIKRVLKTGVNDGKSVYILTENGKAIANTPPLTVEEAVPLLKADRLAHDKLIDKANEMRKR